MMDDTHEIYKWGGVWRFADFGVATYYVANIDGPDGNALPPVSGGDWRVTAGTSPPPDLVHNCGSDEETGRDVRVAFADIKMNTCYSMVNADGLNVKWHETEPSGQCHNGKPIYATEGSMEATSDKFKFVPALCHGGQCGGTNTGSAQSGGKVVLLSRFALSASR